MKNLLFLSLILSVLFGACQLANSTENQKNKTTLSNTEPMSPQGANSMVEAAQALLAGLSPELRKAASFSFDNSDREQWDFVPLDTRKGARLGYMSHQEQKLAFGLLQTGLSEAGYKIARDIMSLEDILIILEKQPEGSDRRNSTKYYISIFGEPSETKPWAWKYEGHHLSLNYSSISGKLSVTPAFMGTNPAEIPIGEEKGKRVLGEEEDKGRALIKSMTDAQQAKAIISQEAYPEIVTGTASIAKLENFEGIPYGELDKAQQATLIDLIQLRLSIMQAEVAKAQWNKIKTKGLENLYFSWAGGLEPGQMHYYRIHGPATIIEYDNAQNNGKHAHIVWRDLENDFGRDLLKEHHQAHKH